jgi:hypothetical protein
MKRIIAMGFRQVVRFAFHRLPNQALKPTEWAWEQFSLRIKFWMLNNLFISVNLVCFVNYENIQRRSLAPVRYTATKSLGCYSFPVKLF